MHDFSENSRAARAAANGRFRHATAGLKQWFLADTAVRHGRHAGPHGRVEQEQRAHWVRVMCLTGLDYFSTLGYQPAIAALAAGAIAPLATIVLIVVTLAAALPVYRRVARESPHGTGSIAMLVRILPHWSGKLTVLVLLGFVITDFVITMTLSASDATAHLRQNPLVAPALTGHEVIITLALISGLAIVFLRGFQDALRVATVLVTLFLTGNLIVIIVALAHIAEHPVLIGAWWTVLTTQHSDPFFAIAMALLVFPKLALGLSGFETGVVVMPQIRGDATDMEDHPLGRIRKTRHLLTTSALIMSVFLLASSFVTVVLIPAAAFQDGGAANGRALAYLAHEYLGQGFGSLYDLVMVGILWFAGASAMAGLLNLVPRYLPHYGMAPAWAQTTRPVVLVIAATANIVTIIFDANVTAQGAAYATGLLVLMTSAAVAVTLSAAHQHQRGATIGYGLISIVFVYTTVANSIERPDGLKIAAVFIVAILLVSMISRTVRSTELRATSIHFDATARTFMRHRAHDVVHLIAHETGRGQRYSYAENLRHAQSAHGVPAEDAVFIEVVIADSSEFESAVSVRGVYRGSYRVLIAQGTTVANTIAAIAMHARDTYHDETHVYFRWTEGAPVTNFLRYVLFGEGAVAAMTREVLRQAEPNLATRPWVHVA